MNGDFEQSGGMGFEGAALNGGLTRQLGLNFRPDVNGDGRVVFDASGKNLRMNMGSAPVLSSSGKRRIEGGHIWTLHCRRISASRWSGKSPEAIIEASPN